MPPLILFVEYADAYTALYTSIDPGSNCNMALWCHEMLYPFDRIWQDLYNVSYIQTMQSID